MDLDTQDVFMSPTEHVRLILLSHGIDDRVEIENGTVYAGEYTDYDDMKESEEHCYEQIDSMQPDMNSIGYEVCSCGIEHDYVGYEVAPL